MLEGRSAVFVVGATLVTLLSLTACEGSDPLTGPDGGQPGAIAGSIESPSASRSSPDAGTASAAEPSRSSDTAAQAATVVAMSVDGDGSLSALAEAEVQADGRFTIEDVPVGRSDIFLSARTDGGEEVGRTLVHGETEAGVTIVTEPMSGETTVEGRVFEALIESGASAEIRNTARLALFVRLEEATALQVAASAQAVQEMTEAYRASAEAQGEVFARMGADKTAQSDALIEAALEHAESRDGGADAGLAQQSFIYAALAAWAQGDVDDEEVSLATAAGATVLAQAETVANEDARLALFRNLTTLNLSARGKVANDLPSSHSVEGSTALSALAEADVRVRAATSVGDIAQALLETEESLEGELVSLIMGKVPEEVSNEVRVEIQARLEAAFAEADLSASARGSADVDGIVQTVLDYRARVRSAVQAFVETLPNEVSIGADATTRLLIAARGGPGVESGT